MNNYPLPNGYHITMEHAKTCMLVSSSIIPVELKDNHISGNKDLQDILKTIHPRMFGNTTVINLDLVFET